MDIKELTDLLVNSCETNRCKYIPWWEDDFHNCIYRYNIFKDEEIKDIEECVNNCGMDELIQPSGNMGLNLFQLLIWHNFYDIIADILGNTDNNGIINTTGSKGITPLMLACSRGNLKMAKLLLKHGADVSACDTDGKNVYNYLASPYIKGLMSAYECQRKSLLQIREIARILPEGDNKEYINQKDKDGMTPLVRMLNGSNTNSSWALTDIFLEKGADTNYIDENGNTLLIMAICNRHMTAALKLIEAGTDVNCSNNEGRTPLVLAEHLYSEALCMALKEHGAEGTCSLCNMDLNNLARITSNAFASFSEDEMDNKSIALYLARKLVEQVDTDDDDDMKCLSGIFYNALANDKGCEVLDICYKCGIDFTAPVHSGGSVTCLRDECISRYNTGVIKKFISFGIDINEPVANGKTPAFIVASLQKRNMMYGRKDDYYEKAAGFFSKESMEYASNDGTTAMHQAARNNHSGMLKVMIEKGADANITGDGPSEAGNTPLHTACIYGSTDAAKVLIGNGADDSMQNADGETPAHFAVMKKKFGGGLKTEEREALLKELKNLDIARNDGKTPLMVLQYIDLNTNTSLLPLFLERGVDVNHKDNYGNTALILNTQNRCYKGIVKELVHAGADINAIDNNGNNALYYALEYGNQEVARFLIKKGADYNRANNKGVTPAQLIVEKGYDTLLGLMDGI